MSVREIDTNGWIEIKGNPISKVGVFPYSGANLSKDLDQDKIYYVLRPPEELSNSETIRSFRLLPWTDDHPSTLLGSAEQDKVPAESKGVHGVIGEEIYFDNEFLRANLKVFSEELANLIESGKKELSIGYTSDYESKSGIYEGQEYDFIQRNIRGNHISLVDQGRSGPEVRVLDQKENFNEGSIVKEEEKKKETADEGEGEMTLQSIMEKIAELIAKVEAVISTKKSDIDQIDIPGEGSAEMYDKKGKDEDEGKEKEKKEEKKESMDAAQFKKSIFSEISKRNELAEKLSWQIGTFDSVEMTLEEVAQYGLKKLGLNCKKGHEFSTLDGYLAGVKVNNQSVNVMDSVQPESSQIENFLNGGK